MSRKLSKSDIIDWLLKDSRGISIIGDYIDDRTKTEFKCHNDDHPSWYATPNNIKRGRGCPKCSKMTKLSTKDMESWLLNDGRGITIVSEYLGHHKKSLFKCSNIEHEPWLATPCHIKNGKGCPKCATSGFKTDSPAWSYILMFEDYLKYGITNNLQQRLWTHKHKNGDFRLVFSKYHQDGHSAVIWENDIKRTYGGNYVTKERCVDGYTETLPLHMSEHISE